MTRKEFGEKYYDIIIGEDVCTSEVLMRIASNLSDMQVVNSMFSQNKDLDDMMNKLKKYIFDYMDVEKSERRAKIEELNSSK